MLKMHSLLMMTTLHACNARMGSGSMLVLLLCLTAKHNVLIVLLLLMNLLMLVVVGSIKLGDCLLGLSGGQE